MTQLGEATIPIRAVLDKLDGDLASARGKVESTLSKIGGSIKGLGDKLLKGIGIGMAGIAGGIAAALGGLTALALKSAAAADELAEMSVKTGISVERLQELKFIGEQTGTSLETVTSSLARMIRGMGDAATGTGTAGDAFETLGISVVDANGNLRDSQEVFAETLDKLGALENPTLRDSLAMDIFGRSAQELNPLIEAGAEGMAEMAGQARGLGAILSKKTVEVLAAVNDKLAGLKMGLAGAGARLAGAFLPVLTKVADTLTGWLSNPVVQKGLDTIAAGIEGMVNALLAGDLGGIFDTLAVTLFKLTGNAEIGIFFYNLGKRLEALAATIGKFVNETLVPFIREHWEELKGALIAVGAVLAGAAIVSGIAAIAGVIAALASPVGIIIAAAALLGAAWAGNWGGIQEKTAAVWAVVQPVLQQAWNWLQVTLPLALQWLSNVWQTVLLPAIQAVWAWVQGTLFPLLAQLWAWLQTNIPIAIQALSDFWTNTLLPAITSVWSWIQTSLIPMLSTLWTWLATNVPAAIQTLSDFWTGTLLPAITGIWEFINTSLVPLFTTLGELLSVTLSLAITALAGLWQNVLQPALSAVWEFISTSLQPVFDTLAAFFKDTLGPNIETVKTNVLDKLPGVFNAIKTAIQWVIDKINALITKLKEIKLPGWLTPGSPTPFELGLRGIGSALDDLARAQLPELAASLDLNVATLAGPAGAAAAGGGTINIQPGAIIIQAYPGVNAELLARQILEYIAREKRMGKNSGLSFSTTG